MKKLLVAAAMMLLVSGLGLCMAEELPMITEPIPDTQVLLPAVKGTITITEGWNLIAMPVLPLQSYTVEQFIKRVESPFKPIIGPIKLSEGENVGKDENGTNIIILPKKQWEVGVVAVYKNGRFERYPKEGVTYNMVPGEAYFVHAKYLGRRPMFSPGIDSDGNIVYPPVWHPSTSVTIIGKPLDTPVSLNLNRGWNGVSIAPLSNIILRSDSMSTETQVMRLYTLDQLSKELAEQNIKAKRIAFWSKEKQEWELHELPIITYKPQEGVIIEHWIRVINPDEGFFLLCDENGLFINSLNTKIEPKPPVPPFPPKPPINEIVVKYTGKVEGVHYISFGAAPPYQYNLVTNDGAVIHLTAANDEIAKQLKGLAESGELVTVAGVMTIIKWNTGRPPDYVAEDKVLKVIAVYRATISRY